MFPHREKQTPAQAQPVVPGTDRCRVRRERSVCRYRHWLRLEPAPARWRGRFLVLAGYMQGLPSALDQRCEHALRADSRKESVSYVERSREFQQKSEHGSKSLERRLLPPLVGNAIF